MSTPIIPPTPPAKADEKQKDDAPRVSKLASAPQAADGTTTLEKDVALEGEILAFEALERIANMVAKEIVAAGPKRIYILNDLSQRALEMQQSSELQTSHLRAVFDSIKGQLDQLEPNPEREEVMVEATGAVTAAVGMISTLAGLFRIDASMRGAVFTPPQEGFLNSITRRLLRISRDIEIRNPNFMVYSPATAEQASHRRVLARFNAVDRARFNAEQSLEKLSQRVLVLQFMLDPPKPQPAPSAAEAAALASELALKKPVLQSAAKAMDQAQARWAELQKQLDTVGTDQHSGLGLLGHAEELLAWAQQPPGKTFFLAARCLSLRANFKTQRGVLTNLTGHDSSSYSGGAIATYALLAADATVKASGTHRYRTPYLKFDDQDAEPESGNSFNEKFETLD